MGAIEVSRKELGVYGEDLACEYYRDHGFEIIDRNVHISRVGEIDVIAVRIFNGINEFHFVEVKTRRGVCSGFGYEAVGKAKRLTMMRCALEWIRQQESLVYTKKSLCLDVVSIDTSGNFPSIQVFYNIEV